MTRRPPGLIAFAIAAAVVCVPAPAAAQLIKPVPELEGLEVVERRGEKVPRDLVFTDTRGNEVMLAQLLDGERPVLLSLNYSNCPMLCDLQLSALAETLGKMKYDAGEQYRFVSVSINPLEAHRTAALTRKTFTQRMAAAGKESAVVENRGVEFLVGKQAAIKELAAGVGFPYRYLPEKKQYVHFPVLILLTPDGTISRYLHGIDFSPNDLRLSLYEAAEGKISGVYEKVVLSCFQFNPSEGKYTAFAWGLMRFSGVVMLCILAAILVPAWVGGSRIAAERAAAAGEHEASASEEGGPQA